MKSIYLIHGWGGDPNSEPWFDWLKKQGNILGYEVKIPEMPNTDSPKVNEWIKILNNIVDLNNEVYLVGHSIGCQAIMRYLERLPTNTKIKGCIFIAGWFDLLETAYEAEEEKELIEEKEIAHNWINSKIDLKNVKNKSNKFLSIFSSNDPCVNVNQSKIFKEELNSQIIIKNNESHFNETKQIQEILDFIKDN